jgi:hypothetical protein
MLNSPSLNRECSRCEQEIPLAQHAALRTGPRVHDSLLWQTSEQLHLHTPALVSFQMIDDGPPGRRQRHRACDEVIHSTVSVVETIAQLRCRPAEVLTFRNDPLPSVYRGCALSIPPQEHTVHEDVAVMNLDCVARKPDTRLMNGYLS